MSGFLQDANGNNSSLRLVLIIIVLGIVGVWAYLCITKGEFIEFPIKTLVAIVLPLLAKLVQNGQEQKAQNKPSGASESKTLSP